MSPRLNSSSAAEKPPAKKRVRKTAKASPNVITYPTRPLPPLPQEIWNMIGSNVNDNKTLAHLCLVSHAFYVQFTPILYGTVSFSASSFPKIRKFLKAVQPIMTIAQKYQLSGVSDYVGQEDKWPGDVDQDMKPIASSYVHTMRVGSFHPGENHEEIMMWYLKYAMANCSNLKTLLWSENALRLTDSIVSTILSRQYLKNLKIYLDCGFTTRQLAQLHPLEYFEVSTTFKFEDWHHVMWMPGDPPEREDTALHTLRAILRTSQKTLKHLILNDRYAKSVGFRGPNKYTNCSFQGVEVARRIFGGMKHTPDEMGNDLDYAGSIPWDTVVGLERLETLVLHGFGIDAAALEVLVEAVDFSKLSRLELANGTTGVESLLEVLATRPEASVSRLKSLFIELDSPRFEKGPLTDYLMSFRGLEELHIAGEYKETGPGKFSPSFFEAVANHSGTLRSLNLHLEGTGGYGPGIPEMDAEGVRQIWLTCPLLEKLAFRPDWHDWRNIHTHFPRFKHLSHLLLRSSPHRELISWPDPYGDDENNWSLDSTQSILPTWSMKNHNSPFVTELLEAYLQAPSTKAAGVQFNWDKHCPLRQFGFGSMPLWIPVVKPERVWEWDWVNEPQRGQGRMMMWEVAQEIVEVKKKGGRRKVVPAIGTVQADGRKVMHMFLQGEKGALNKGVDEFFGKRYWGWEEWEKTKPEYTP